MKKCLVAGVGINDLRSYHGCPFYYRWASMLKRCYRPRPKEVHYHGCKVADEWLRFSVFKEWMERQPWDGNDLDKDILSRELKIYQPSTSVFVPRWLNVQMIRMEHRANHLPTGVRHDARNGKKPYISVIRDPLGEHIRLGTFSSPDDAHQAWRKAKAASLMACAERYALLPCFDQRVLDAVKAESARMFT
jgi:hypothetical protein